MNANKNKTSIKLFIYNKDDIEALRKDASILISMTGTVSVHEMTADADGKVYAKNNSFDKERLLSLKF